MQFLVSPGESQKVQLLLYQLMTVLRALNPDKGMEHVGMTRKYLETLEQMVNVQEILALVWTLPDPLANGMKFLHSYAEIV